MTNKPTADVRWEKWAEIATPSRQEQSCARCSTGFSVFWGIFMLIILLGGGPGSSERFRVRLPQHRGELDRHLGRSDQPSLAGLPVNRDIQLTWGPGPSGTHSRPGAHRRNTACGAGAVAELRRELRQLQPSRASSPNTACLKQQTGRLSGSSTKWTWPMPRKVSRSPRTRRRACSRTRTRCTNGCR